MREDARLESPLFDISNSFDYRLIYRRAKTFSINRFFDAVNFC
ncbi:MAG: hypothetical protein JWN60_2638 [Acidobacteria bacterium]|jgi:hypothetical protein|nr:hypothetical protein [Acidobacteriota bacterium]